MRVARSDAVIPDDVTALRAELRTILHRAGTFQLLEAVLARAITPEEYVAEVERRHVVRTYPGRIYAGTAMVLVLALAATVAALWEVWWVWVISVALAAEGAQGVCRDVLAWRRAKTLDG